MSNNFKILKENYVSKNDKNIVVAIIEGKSAATMTDFYNQMSKQLHLPSYFGKNLDAFYDCLCDFSWLDSNHIQIILRDYDDFLSKEPPLKRWDLLVVLNDAVNEWKGMKGKDKVKLEILVEPNQRMKKDLEDAEI
jgi:RNAse (barnase) inhibitor barstar